ncbi:hypothetical protein E3N88_31889 [Mikania micrantha]|uniref:Rx N-terminal domain-containing protein n=1 Tax=Mikania micrantha TaxID=192012 RepID=A0A5N6M6Y2_9ASTR|nr:hypothetical protein E3N88_31889 [Mikania micrantha]
MAVGEIILTAFIKVLFEKLVSSDMMKLARYAGILSKLENLRSNLQLIQAVLVDAGQKHISDTSVELWLNELHHLAYEIDDVLDDLVIEATRRLMKNQESDASTSNNTKSKVLQFIPNKFHAVKYGRKMSPKIDEITTKLHDLVEKKKILGLKDNAERSSRPRKRIEETSLVDESKVIGREDDKEALLGMLLGSESSSTQTTNVNVGWELLQRPFTAGAPGSKVLVTTRKTTVASAMDSVQAYNLELLSDEDALSLFAQHASAMQNFDDVSRKLKFVAGEFFFMLDDKMNLDDRHKGVDKFHHLSFIREKYTSYQKFKALQRVRRLRTLLAMPVWIKWKCLFIMSDKVLSELLPQLRVLRVLSLANYNFAQVPESIGLLKHMRYLNLSKTPIKCLPKQVGDLHNLQSLLLSHCDNLSSLPSSIVKLINLRHLDISNTPVLNKMPLGLAKEAKLQHKKGICDLELEWSDVFDDSRNKETEYEVLEGLRPFKKLTSLRIWNYGGREFPSWFGDLSFDCLTQLALLGCKSCTCLPALGHLPSLKKLKVYNMDGLKSVGSEFLGLASNGVAFPSLEVLSFSCMEGWEKWSTRGGKSNMFPCLREIYMSYCEKLDEVTIESIPSLQVLHVEGCSETVLKSMVGVSSSIVRLTVRYIRGLTKLYVDVLGHLEKVDDLSISNCDELTHIWNSEVACKILLKLKNLEVKECKQLLSLGETKMPSITNLVIDSCESLKGYNCPSSINNLNIFNCHSLKSLSFTTMEGLPSTLKSLHIVGCYNVEVSWLVLSSLQRLYISKLVNMRLFPTGCLLHLATLKIEGCDNLESIPDDGYGFLPSCCLIELRIADCKNLKSFPHKHLQRFESLKKIVIYGCPNLDYSFPGGLWPPNLIILEIGKLKKPISKWGMQNFPTSLVKLTLYDGEDSGVVTFAKAEEEDTSSSSSSSSSYFLLPSSLISLSLNNFNELESLLKGLQHLMCLQHLEIMECPKLRDLPETLLPSLLRLTVYFECSQELRKKCSKSKNGKYWPIISQIPHLRLDSRFHN